MTALVIGPTVLIGSAWLTFALPIEAAPPEGQGTSAFDAAQTSQVPIVGLVRTGVTSQEINNLVGQQGLRLVALDPEPAGAAAGGNMVAGSTFVAAFVPNTGVYQRTTWWFPALTAKEVGEKVLSLSAQVLDIDPYVLGNLGQRFAVLLAPSDSLPSFVDPDMTDQELADLKKADVYRITKFETYKTKLGVRHAVVGRSTSEAISVFADQYPDNIRCALGLQCSQPNQLRLRSLSPTPSGRWNAIAVPDYGGSWGFEVGLSSEALQRSYQSRGFRVIDIAAYLENGETRYAYVGIDTLDVESSRLRGLANQAYDLQSKGFGFDVQRGFQVKETGGPVIAAMAASLPMQMMSVAKLVTYLYAVDQIDRGLASLDSQVTWVQPVADDPKTAEDDRLMRVCVPKRTRGTTVGGATWRDALPTLMWFSHNRTLEAFYDLFTSAAINDRAQQSMAAGGFGLSNTVVYTGCPQKSGKKDEKVKTWIDNRTTLQDVSWLFEGVRTGVLVPKGKEIFFDHMAVKSPGKPVTYVSGILGQEVSSGSLGSLYDVIVQEAGALHKDDVAKFVTNTVIHSKGGSGADGSANGFAGASEVLLPFFDGGLLQQRSFTSDWFIYGMKKPQACGSSSAFIFGDIAADPAASQDCKALLTQELVDMSTFSAELLRVPIRMAWATWPVPMSEPSSAPLPSPTPSPTGR